MEPILLGGVGPVQHAQGNEFRAGFNEYLEIILVEIFQWILR